MKRYLLMMLAMTPLAVLAAQADVDQLFVNEWQIKRGAVSAEVSRAYDPALNVFFQKNQEAFFLLAHSAAKKPDMAMKPGNESGREPDFRGMDSDDTSDDGEVQMAQNGNGNNGDDGEENGNGDKEDENGDDDKGDEEEEDKEDKGEGGWDRLWDAPKLG